MKKEDFFVVLGELDDDIVKGAKSTMEENKNRKPAWVKCKAQKDRKKHVRITWGAMAAFSYWLSELSFGIRQLTTAGV